jgi:hypothetical protein
VSKEIHDTPNDAIAIVEACRPQAMAMFIMARFNQPVTPLP